MRKINTHKHTNTTQENEMQPEKKMLKTNK